MKKRLQAALDENESLRARIARLEESVLDKQTDCEEDFSEDDTDVMTVDKMSENHDEPAVPRNDVSLLTTMSSWTLSTINIPECTPSEGESEIDKRAYEYWKDTFISSIRLINATDELTLFGLFKVKAGPKLREIYQTTVSVPEMSSEITNPFSNAMERLDEYFGSRTYILAQRGKLMNMAQAPTEQSIQFVRRVGTAAKLCNYTDEEEMEAVVRVITKGALDARVRVLAHRNWVRQGSMKDLIDLVRDRELEKANEEEFQRSHSQQECKTIAAFSQQPRQTQNNYRSNFSENWRFGLRGRHGSYRGRGRGLPNRGFQHNRVHGSGNNCWRCGSIYHHPNQCPVIQKVCRNCGKVGHIARVCSEAVGQAGPSGSRKRRNELREEAVNSKIAAIEDAGDMKDEVREVEDVSS